MLDTNVAIHLRDRDEEILNKIVVLDDVVILSIITRVELEGGVQREPEKAHLRLPALQAMLEALPVVAFGDQAADTYRQILGVAGYSRRKVLDRMIAAQALVHRATLITRHPDDFRDVPGLELLAW